MQHFNRFTLTLFVVLTLSGTVFAVNGPQGPITDTTASAAPATKPSAAAPVKPASKSVEYKRSDANFYWKGDVLKVYPSAVILTAGNYTQKGDSYFFTPKIKAPKEIYVQVVNDWIEPITPPDMPASLGVASDAMQIREPQGDVQVAVPSAPATFAPVTDGMAIPNGAVVKTGDNGTAAVLFGGVDSARLIPDSAAAVQQTVTATSRSTEVDLTKGAVFSKVGQRIGEKEDYQVHTPFGVAAARGTDFVTIAMPARTDVWIAQGTVQMDQPNGKMVGMVKSEGTGALKIVRFPLMPDPTQTMMASAETMTAAMNFIPMVNVKTKALRDKIASGVKLTANETDYLNRIKKVPCLIKLALVEPIAPMPAAAPATTVNSGTLIPPAPSANPTMSASANPAAPVRPTTLHVRTDGKVGFQHATLSLDDLKPKLEAIAKATPEQPFVIKPGKKVTDAQLQQVVGLCHAAGLTNITVVPPPPPAPPAPATSAMLATPAAAPEATPASPATNAPASPIAPIPPASLLPMNLKVRPDGKVDLQDATLTLDELKLKLDEVALVTPSRSLVIEADKMATHGQIEKVINLCRGDQLNVTLAKAGTASGSLAAASNATDGTPAKPKSERSYASSPNVPIATGPNDTIP